MSLESIFTPPGQHARQNQDERNSGVAQVGSDIVNAAAPGVMNQIKFGQTLEPSRQNSIRKAIALASPGMQAALAERQVGGITQNAQDAIANTTNQFQASGLSAGALAGAIGDIGNNKTASINTARNAVFDPITQARLAEITAGIATQGQKVDYSGVNAGGGLAYGQPQTYVGKGLGDFAGEALGQWAGGGFKTGGK